jgi:hypothetical protein
LLKSQIKAGEIKKEPGVLIKAKDINNRLPKQVNKLLNWADWYANNKEKTATESALKKAIKPLIFKDFNDLTLSALSALLLTRLSTKYVLLITMYIPSPRVLIQLKQKTRLLLPLLTRRGIIFLVP